jgi:hypothetical protein
MNMDVAHHRIFDPPHIIDDCELKKRRKFLHLKFDNKGIDAVNINNVGWSSFIKTYNLL